MKMFTIFSYKRKIIWLLVVMLCVGILYRTVRERNLYTVYLDDLPIAVTSVKPETVLQTYGDVKAMRYAQGGEEIKTEISVEEFDGNSSMGTHILNGDELTDTIYRNLDDTQPILTGMCKKYYTDVKPYYESCEYVFDDELYEGETEVYCEGSEGIREITVEATYYNEQEITQKAIDSEIIKEAVPKVVHIGTKERPQYVLPVEGYTLTSGFGERWGRNHDGVDLAVPVGTNVHASADGIVTRSEWFGGYGMCIDIDHGDGSVTRYAHMSSNIAEVGQYVEQGDIIGLSGNTGNSTGPHLHFEIMLNDIAVDPQEYAVDAIMW